jgi:thiamine pyrophosphate-dependent acetolactate synthase large subunit-like protein
VLAPDHPLLARADLIVAIGVDPTELPPGGLPSTPIAHVGPSAWPAAGLAADVIGDIALVIEEMAPRVRARRAADWDVAELDRIKRAVRHALGSTPAGRMVALAREATPAGTIATGDVPALAAWSAVAPRETLGALGLATPGYALMAAIAARLTYPDRRVVAFTDARGLASAPPGLASVSPGGPAITLVSFGGHGPVADTVVETTEAAFTGDFARAWVSGRPTLLSVGGL